MAIALQGTPSLFESASATSAAVTYPAGIVSGELLILSLAISQQVALTAAPAGWTLAKAQNSPSSTEWPAISVYYKVAAGTETGTVTFGPWTTAGRTTAIMSRWSGVDTATPMDTLAQGDVGTATVSYVEPSITTATNSAVVIHTVGVNASSSEDILTNTNTTLVGKSTGTGRRMGQWSEVRATAGATGTRTWNLSPGTTALPWASVAIALRASGAPVQPSLIQRVVGIPTTNPGTSAVVQVKVANCNSVRLKVSTDAAGTQGVVYGGAVTPSALGDARLTVSGLTANTRYYYRIAMTGASSEILDTAATIGRLKTAPVGQGSFSFCFGSCWSGTDTVAADAMAARGDDMFLLLGDLYYADGTATTLDNFRSKQSEKITTYQSIFATANTAYTPSDHDGFNNNSTAGDAPTAWTNWNTVRNELWPMPSNYYTFVWGRVRFIVLDDRSFKSPVGLVDNASKTALGATQKQWLKDTITAATEPVIMIAQASPWVGSAIAGDDGWFGYTTERTELANFFQASGKKIIMLAGDMHAVAADDGTNSPGKIPVFQAAPFTQNSSIKGGPYTVPPYPATAGTAVSQYGRVVVSDDGTQITVTFTGYSAFSNTQRATLSVGYAPVVPMTMVPAVFVATATGWVRCEIGVP